MHQANGMKIYKFLGKTRSKKKLVNKISAAGDGIRVKMGFTDRKNLFILTYWWALINYAVFLHKRRESMRNEASEKRKEHSQNDHQRFSWNKKKNI